MEDDVLVFRKVFAKWFIRKNDGASRCELCSEINIPEDANSNVKQRKGTGYTNIRSHLVSSIFQRRIQKLETTSNAYPIILIFWYQPRPEMCLVG